MVVWKVQFTTEAITELQAAIDYYQEIKDHLGIEFMFEFDTQIQKISRNPFSRSIRYLNVRFAVLNRFPYAIHYTINEVTHNIIVQTVLCTSRDFNSNP